MNLGLEKSSAFFFLKFYISSSTFFIYILCLIKNHMDKIEKPSCSIMEITKSFVVNQIKNINPRKLLKILTNASIMVLFQKVLKYLR